MEKLKVKNWLLVGMITAGMFSTTVTFAKDKEVTSLKGNQLANRKEYRDMKATLSRIENDKARIDFKKKAYKNYKHSDMVIESHMSLKEKRKAKADLKRDKKFLRIDKRDLKNDQKYALAEQRKTQRETKKELCKAKCELRKDLRKGNTAELEGDAKHIALLTAQQEAKEKEHLALKEDVDDFFSYLDNEIDEVV